MDYFFKGVQMKIYIMMLFVMASLSACGNTVVGVGQDIKTMGERIMEPSEEKKNEK